MTAPDWPAYYAVTVDRPAWSTVLEAIRRFELEDGAAGGVRSAVDLGCGAGRDARALLRSGWHVLAVDREPGGIAALVASRSWGSAEGLDHPCGGGHSPPVIASSVPFPGVGLPGA